MLTENDAVEIETTEVIVVTDAPMAAKEAETVVEHVDDAANPAPAAISETDPVPETDNLPETTAESEPDTMAVLVIGASRGDGLKPEELHQPKRHNERRKKKKKPKPDPALTKVMAGFAACGRCSFFLAGYKVVGGVGALTSAVGQQNVGQQNVGQQNVGQQNVGQQNVGQQNVGQQNDKWLALGWSQAIADLVHKSYGSRVDIDHFHYEGRCQECRRSFIYHDPEDGDAPTFRIEIGA